MSIDYVYVDLLIFLSFFFCCLFYSGYSWTLAYVFIIKGKNKIILLCLDMPGLHSRRNETL